MENNNKKSIELLNTLIEINNERILGYQTASKGAEERDIKNLFSQLGKTSKKFKEELSDEVTKLGGEPSEKGKVLGKVFRKWMDVKTTITGKSYKAVLDSCKLGEDVAIQAYEATIKTGDGVLSPELHQLLIDEYTLLKDDYDHIIRLRDTAVA